jgi:hypothetical protein
MNELGRDRSGGKINKRVLIPSSLEKFSLWESKQVFGYLVY